MIGSREEYSDNQVGVSNGCDPRAGRSVGTNSFSALCKHKGTFLTLAAFVAVKILLLSFSVGRQRPWTDEITTLIHTQRPFAEILSSYYNHMTYVVLAKISALVFGDSFLSLRIPAAVLGVLGIPCVYLLGKTIYSRTTGFLFALFLVFLPEYHLFSQEARGYIGVMVLLPLAASLIWFSLISFSTGKVILAASMVFAAFLLHPTALLFVPGLSLYLGVLLLAGHVQHVRGQPFRFSLRSIWLTVVSLLGTFLVPLAIFFVFYGSITRVPGQVLGEEESVVQAKVENGGPQEETVVRRIRRPVDVPKMVAPFVSARNHTGPILTFGLVLCFLGIVLPRGSRKWGSLFLFCIATFPIVFFYFYKPAEMPQRYLTPSLPFFCLLMMEGIVALGRFAAGPLPPALKTVGRRAVIASLLCVLLYNCLGPLAVGIKYGTFAQGAAWQYSLSHYLEHPSLSGSRVGIASKKWWFWQKQLAAMGVDPNHFLRLEKEGANWNAIQPSQVEVLCEDDSPIVLAFPDTQPGEQMDRTLRQAGFETVWLDFVTVFFRTTSMVGGSDDRNRVVEDLCLWADSECRLDYQFYLPAAALLRDLGNKELGDRFEQHAEKEMKERIRFDFPNNAHVARRLARHCMENNRTPEALRWYCYALDHSRSGFRVFTAFIEDLPTEAVQETIATGLMDPDRFARSLVQRLRSDTSLEKSGKAYWAYRGGEELSQAGMRDGAARLFEYSISCGDTQNRAQRALVDLWLRFEDPLRAADFMFSGVPRKDAALKDYTIVFERLPRTIWKEAARKESFDAEGYVRGLQDLLDADTEMGDKGKAYWAYRAAEFFIETEQKDHALSLLQFSIEHGDTDGRSAAALARIEED